MGDDQMVNFQTESICQILDILFLDISQVCSNNIKCPDYNIAILEWSYEEKES